MPGGSSVGGLDNARVVSAIGRDGETRRYKSIQAAIADCNAERAGSARVRAPFAIGGTVYNKLQAASNATGLLLDTLRSRLHRAKKSGPAGIPQIGQDRRARAPGRLEPLLIPWPTTDEHLTASEFAVRSGIAKATLIRRWHRARTRFSDSTKPSAYAVYTFLTMPADGMRAAADALDRLLSDVLSPNAGSLSGGARAHVDPGTK